MTMDTDEARRLVFAAVAVSLLALLGANPASAQDCRFEPDSEDERGQCLARCDEDEAGERRSDFERAQCRALMSYDWETIDHCSSVAPGDEQERCIRDAHLQRSIVEAVDRVSRHQQALAAIAFTECARGGRDLQSCFGPPRLTPPRPPSPFLISVLRQMSPDARDVLRKQMSAALDARHEAERSTLEEAFESTEIEGVEQSPREQEDTE